MSFAFSLILVSVIVVLAIQSKGRTFAIYALSFWHYYLYFLAYRFGAVNLSDFKRDAVLMKTVSILVLGFVYFSAPISLVSLLVVMSGFLLNAYAAAVLGTDRTYYGYEVGELPPEHVSSFPFSIIAHPMLAGNITAFGGTLLNSEFRRDWWMLAALHIVLNIGLLLMELYVTPLRRSTKIRVRENSARVYPTLLFILLIVAGATGATVLFSPDWQMMLPVSGATACIAGYAYLLYRYYSKPVFKPNQ